jgi:organic radical activating enzyme
MPTPLLDHPAPTRAAGTPPAPPSLAVVECFGPTWQGEGPNLGRRCAFLRLADCNLACGWCDTRYSWDWDIHDRDRNVTQRTVEALTDQLLGFNVGLVIVSGGEPMLQKRILSGLLLNLAALRVETNIETNGTIPPTDMTLPDLLVVSPKLAHSGDPEPKRLRPRSLDAFASIADSDPARVAWKFVAGHPEDLGEVARLVDRYQLDPARVWIMPEGRSNQAITDHLRVLAPTVEALGYNLTTRLHVTLWDDTRGR